MPLSRRAFIRVGTTGAAAGMLGFTSHAQQPQSSTPAGLGNRSKSGAEYITQETQGAIDRGLDFLARNQLSDGSFVENNNGATVGITSLAALALMAAGNQPGRGKYGKHVSRAVDYVTGMANGPHPGFLTTPSSQSGPRLATNPAPMYSHGFGTLFLSEVCGMLPSAGGDNKVRGALEQAVALIVSSQNMLGGWRYEPQQVQFADVSVTTAQMMALRAAKNAGIFVRKNVIDNGATYIKGCQMPDGGFSYWKGQGLSAFARTAAAIVGLYSAGIYEGKEVERGLKYLVQFTPGRQFSPREVPPQHYWYGQYYAALAMWTAGDEYWSAWLPAIRDELLARARGGHTWNDLYHGSVYATAMALIVLQLPNNYLPILQK
ncbi:MAG: prenyltransferase/squalene oxidase repeat-containing protein [Gemmataceae bacterium]